MLVELQDRLVDLDQACVAGGARLTPMESKLLRFLVERPKRSFAPRDLLREVWGYRATNSKTVKTTINRLRRKVEADPSNPRHLLFTRGLGYRFEPLEVARKAAAVEAFGRDAELARIDALFEAGERLVTLLGPAGVGKTHLARAVLGRSGGHFVPFEAVEDGRAIPAAVASAHGIDPRGVPTALSRGHLVVLDNAEHLIAPLSELIQAWSGARLLITSQRALELPHEFLVPVGPLAPDAAQALLEDRAARQGLPIDAAEATIQTLLEQTEGLPLALELAATRLTLGSEALVRRPEILDEGVGTRHSGLHAALRWSWELLEPEARDDLAALACFGGSFDLRGAGRVLDRPGVSRRVAFLRARSWVFEREGRYHLLDTVRRFARPHADDATRDRHLDWVLQTAADSRAGLTTATAPEHLARLRHLEPELRRLVDEPEALDALCELYDKDMRVEERIELQKRFDTPRTRRAAALALRHQGHRAQASALLEADEDADALRIRSLLARENADYGDAELLLVDALHLADNANLIAYLLATLAQLHALRGDPAAAIPLLDEALETVGVEGSPWTRGFVLYSLAAALLEQGDADRVLSIADEALALQPRTWTRLTLHVMRAAANLDLDDLDGVLEELDEAAEIAHRIESTTQLASIALYGGVVGLLRGEIDEPLRAFREAVRTWRKTGHLLHLAYGLCYQATALKAASRGAEALKCLDRAQRLGHEVHDITSCADAIRAAITGVPYDAPDDAVWELRIIRKLLAAQD